MTWRSRRVDGGQLPAAVQPKRAGLMRAGDQRAVGGVESGERARHGVACAGRQLREQRRVDGAGGLRATRRYAAAGCIAIVERRVVAARRSGNVSVSEA